MNEKKVIIITGANSGIGRETTRRLAADGHEVLMICRNKVQGEKARSDIVRETQNKKVTLFIADLASFSHIHQMAAEIRKYYQKIDVLINNAGIFVTRRQYTVDGYELQWGVNHLAHYLLTHLLLDLLKNAGEARIINVSSVAHYKGTIHFNDLYLEKNYNGLTAYRQSKLANVLFTFELAERLSGTGVTVNCLHPGMIRTGIGHRNNRHWMGLLWWLYKPWMRRVEEGASVIIKLATDPELKQVTGKYFNSSGQIRDPNPMAFDAEIRKRFWEISELQIFHKTSR
jgi:NAD(P)-dependent dehydrogenase (short-subunit alcohol dehydrogenase family)